jgi:N4-gp56 family major capsid protein
LQFKNTALRAEPSSGTSTTAINLDTNGVASQTNNVALGTGHVKAIVDTAKERNIPPYTADDYVAVSHPTTFRNLKNSLETIHQYTETGLAHIFNGEIGRYESCRFVEQTFVPKGGAANATTYDPWSGAPQNWTNALSSWAFFMGGDTVTL